MYVYLNFLSAKAGDLLIAGVLGQQPFFFVISLHIILRANAQKNRPNRQIVATAQNLTYPHFKSVIRF